MLKKEQKYFFSKFLKIFFQIKKNKNTLQLPSFSIQSFTNSKFKFKNIAHIVYLRF